MESNNYFIYIIESVVTGSLYIGYTRDIHKRVNNHNAGQNISTRDNRPHKLIYYECFLNKYDAIQREQYLKSGWGRRSIKILLSNYFKDTRPL